MLEMAWGLFASLCEVLKLLNKLCSPRFGLGTQCARHRRALRCHMPRASRPPFLGATVNVTIAATGGEDPTEEFVSWY